MATQSDQEFLNELDKKLWNAADKLRSTLDAAQYKHTVLGLIFLKYVSDAFDLRREELKAQFADADHDYFLDPSDFGGIESEEYQAEVNAELEVRDYYLESNTFWVPTAARWEFLQNQNKVVIAGELDVDGKKIRSVGQLIDNALESIEQDNPKLKGVLNKRYTQLQIDQAKLGELIDLIATVPFKHA
ncbi:MAG TPA: type I restriction-modification system subunit M N-terminal domain-containing protein, partial [Cellvibrio sp.]